MTGGISLQSFLFIKKYDKPFLIQGRVKIQRVQLLVGGQMEKETILNILKKYLFYIKDYTNSHGLREQIFKCPNHPDPVRNPNDPHRGHFYINLESLNFQCFYCGLKGKNILQFLIKSPIVQNKVSEEDKMEIFKVLLNRGQISQNTDINVQEFEKQYEQIKEQREKYYEKKKQYLEQYRKTVEQDKRLEKYLINVRRFSKEFISEMMSKSQNNNYSIIFIDDNEGLISKNQKSWIVFDLYQMNLKNTLSNNIIFGFQSRVVNNIGGKIRYKTELFNKDNQNLFQSDLFLKDDFNVSKIEVIYFVEGIFDMLKLSQFLKEKNYDVWNKSVVIQTLGQTRLFSNYKFIDLMNNLKLVVLLYDKDITGEKLQDRQWELYNIFSKKSVEVMIGLHTKFKDIGEMEKSEDLSTIEMLNSSYVLSNLYLLKFYKDKQFNKQEQKE